MLSKKFRDVVLVEIDAEKTMVVSCDSCGGIGEKEFDTLKIPAYFTGRYTLRVSLFEVLSTGAEIAVVSNAVSNEMNPTGFEIIRGIKDELHLADLNNITITGSTEENMKTVSTGIGITVIGIAQTNVLLNQAPEKEDVAVLIGLPKVGNEVVLGEDNEIISYTDLFKLRKFKAVKQIIPVGSKGILYEAENAGNFKLFDAVDIDVKKSGGPSTCVLAIMGKSIAESICPMLDTPCHMIGEYQ